MRGAVLILSGVLAACTPRADDTPPAPEPSPAAQAPAAAVPQPATASPPPPADEAPPTPQGVTVRADPPPPFTYWAPPGSVIRNHGNPGQWLAFVNGRQVKSYYGDACGASRLQSWIGKPVDGFPAQTPPVELRVSAEGDPVIQDLRPIRLNVIHDRQTRRIIEIACY